MFHPTDTTATRSDQRDVIARLHALTAAIRAASQRDDWALAAQLADERSPLLMSLHESVDEVALAMIRDIQAMDADLLANAEAARSRLMHDQSNSLQKIRATNQYNRVALL